MSSTRRRRAPKRAAVSPAVRSGLESLAAGNEATIAAMLDKDVATPDGCADALEEVMGVNAISAEQLLARFFSAELLSAYASGALGVSGNGNEAILAARIASAWAKPRKKKRAKKAPAPDWRTPLFYWRGALAVEAGALRWRGTWVASADGLPTDADFEASPNTFSLATAAADAAPRDARAMPAWSFTAGSYLLDNGGGLEETADLLHGCAARTVDGTRVVAAVGDTAFGRFLSLGVLADDGALTLARRYVGDDDARAGWAEAARVLDEELATPGAPWADLPWRLPAS